MRMHSESEESTLQAIRDRLLEVQDILSLPQLTALITIAIEPGLSVNDLADRIKVPQQTASRLVTMLTGRYQNDPGIVALDPLVTQQINAVDPRKRALFLTDAGIQHVQKFSNH